MIWAPLCKTIGDKTSTFDFLILLRGQRLILAYTRVETSDI